MGFWTRGSAGRGVALVTLAMAAACGGSSNDAADAGANSDAVHDGDRARPETGPALDSASTEGSVKDALFADAPAGDAALEGGDANLPDAGRDATDGAAKAPDAMAGDANDATGPDAADASDAASDAADASDAASDTGPPALAYVGRVDTTDPAGPRFEWPGSEVIAHFTGTAITLQMTDYGNEFDVFVDGASSPTTTLIGASGTTDYPLASGLAAGIHDVVVHRRTEADVSTTQILGATFPGGGALLAPLPRPNRRIEVVGDSISCGLGVLGVGPTCTPTNANEDHTDSYGAVAARALGADLITVAWSGEGVYENYGNSTAEPTLPNLYPYTLPNEPSAATLWDFASFIPDVVVIDLGTNDFWNGDPGPDFQSTYLAFVQTIRAKYGADTYIVCVNGPLLTDPQFTQAETYITNVVDQLTAAGDARVRFLSFGIQSGADGYGCDYHPNVETQAMLAATLESEIQSLLPW